MEGNEGGGEEWKTGVKYGGGEGELVRGCHI